MAKQKYRNTRETSRKTKKEYLPKKFEIKVRCRGIACCFYSVGK
jgi:hypothetical protein